MTTLMITPYAPYRDGIANYAVQEVAAKRRSGVDIEVLSPVPSAAHHHLVIGSPQGMARLLRKAASFDRLEIQVYPELLFGSAPSRVHRAVVWALLALLVRRVPTELRIHEIDYATINCDPLTHRLATAALSAAETISLHTEAERTALAGAIGGEMANMVLVDHGRDFAPRTTADRSEARRTLGLDPDEFVFLSIGFVQRHKGFDRAVRAFDRVRPDRARLVVVGDIRVDHPDLVRYRDELDRLIATTPGTERRAGYVSDEMFDRWLVAADVLVLPYREIWSSGVIERAALFDLPVIVTKVGGLADQARPGTVLVADERELAQAMADAAGAAIQPSAISGTVDRRSIESRIRRRAGTVETDQDDGPADHVRRVGHAVLGNADSVRPGVKHVKKLIQRLTAWQVEPTAAAINELRDATIEAVGELERSRRQPDEE